MCGEPMYWMKPLIDKITGEISIACGKCGKKLTGKLLCFAPGVEFGKYTNWETDKIISHIRMKCSSCGEYSYYDDGDQW